MKLYDSFELDLEQLHKLNDQGYVRNEKGRALIGTLEKSNDELARLITAMNTELNVSVEQERQSMEMVKKISVRNTLPRKYLLT